MSLPENVCIKVTLKGAILFNIPGNYLLSLLGGSMQRLCELFRKDKTK